MIPMREGHRSLWSLVRRRPRFVAVLAVFLVILLVVIQAESASQDDPDFSSEDEAAFFDETQQVDTAPEVAVPEAAEPNASTSTTPAGILPNAVVTVPQRSPEWVQISEESFSGTNPKSNWGLYDGAGTAGFGVRKPSAITVANGVLTINGNGDVVGGMSQNDVSQTYGRWVIKAKQDPGKGFTPAILLWPDSEQWPEDGEIDIAEIHGVNRNEVASTVHYGSNNLQLGHSLVGDFTQWHTYMVDWLPDRITFYVDGVAHFEVTDPAAIPRTNMHLALQLDTGECGAEWIGCADASTPKDVGLHVDSVQVYSIAS